MSRNAQQKNLTNYGVRRSHAHTREDLHQHKGKNTKPGMMIRIDSKGFMLRDNIHANARFSANVEKYSLDNGERQIHVSH